MLPKRYLFPKPCPAAKCFSIKEEHDTLNSKIATVRQLWFFFMKILLLKIKKEKEKKRKKTLKSSSS